MDLVLFGMQGSGKGTQGQLIAKRHKLKTFETGAELRKLAQENSVLGKKIKSIIESGRLVENEVVMEIIENFMKSIGENDIVLFDGLPRKEEQAETFDTLMGKLGREFIGILIEISEEIAMKRLTTRRICGKCKEVYPATYKEIFCAKCRNKLVTRNDDNVNAIATRLKAYRDETLPVIRKYEREGKMIKINGEQTIENVDKDLEAALKNIR